MTNSPAVRVRGLHKRYGRRVALAGIDLDIAYGEVVALLGPNGAGKTSTVEILEGHRSRDGGEVRVLGVDPARVGHSGRAARDWRAGIGIVLQEATDLGELTEGEVVRHFARYFPAPRDPAEVIEVVGLADRARSRVRALSGGQRRRLDVAVGLVGDPRLLFLDEPTTGFDPAARRGFWDLIRTLAGAGTTIVLTTHYLDEAEQLADRVVVLAAGRVVADGPPAVLAGRAGHQAVVRWSGGERRTDDPAAVIAELTRRHGGPVPDLTVTRPSLEDVYLDLIGGRP
ncbi:ABC transporter ATP-binding protein [Micromonospora sp. WMMA1998]|uniref:ABC transporter ATP-binding protein n=1 Tax=Micromonospora sp. WMMA1998 TaxID=3015167 RepID=UPI00248C2B2D|nr:ABC transporter ATP-binding protein [Micromonospora sp. WMMA1998]WBC15691.1 ABC transporter ATP-binding protein [Micromonospora sp. WMMA1998]